MTQHTVDTTGTTPTAAQQTSEPGPRSGPRPARRASERVLFGDTVATPYSWLRDHGDPAVAEHFAAENARADAFTAHLSTLHASLSADLDRPAPQIEPSAPVLLDGWWYIDRSDPADGATLSRVRDRAELRGPSGVPEIIPGTRLKGEQILVEDCRGMIGFAVSPDHRLIARAEAALGGCRLIITDIASGEVVDDAVEGAGPDLVFSADSAALLHTRLDDLGRRHEVRCHRLGSASSEDALLLEEPDHWADLQLTRSRDGSALLIRSDSPAGSEVWMTDLARTCAPVRSLAGRIPDLHPVFEHAGDRLLVVHEDPATRRSVLGEVGLEAMDGLESVATVLTSREGEHYESVEAFAGFVALQVRCDGLPQVRLLPRLADGSLDTLAMRVVGPGGELAATRLEPTPDWHQSTLRYRLDSFLTPPTILEHDADTGEDTVLLRAEMPGHDPQRYLERRLWARSADGTRVPISVFARRDVPLDGTAPGLLYGDGAFGTANDPLLRREAMAVAEHGVVVAVAHVRGGGELGPDWHRQGRRLRKHASFEDFVACAEHLVATGWMAQDRIGAVGTGPGGLLVGAAANLTPERFRAVLAGLPLVDPLETLLDPDVMLTLEEWAEWGDPADDEATYRALAAYSPTENVREAEYPAIFAWTSLDGTEVPPACAAIWVAQLRDHVTNDPAERPVLLRTTATLGAAGDPRVEGVAWLLDQLGATTLAG